MDPNNECVCVSAVGVWGRLEHETMLITGVPSTMYRSDLKANSKVYKMPGRLPSVVGV